ncbi:MAG TPA: sodium:proton antiporter [Gammaproteobacteria bacterium]|nr:sodium:proton antiporter [Gammaproteobacteria bacterium]
MFEHTLTALAAIGVIGVACQWLAWWLKLPAILLLLVAGIVSGPVTGFIQPDALFGDLLFPLVSLGVAVVLFEGSLSLKLHEIRETAGVVRNLVTFGVAVTWLVLTLAAHLLADLDWALALLFGAVVTVTGPTVIVPLLRTMRPTANIANILRWEGIIIDPVGALLAVLVFEFIVSGQEGSTLRTFGTMLASGIGIGTAGAFALATVLRRHWVPDFLVNVTTLVLVLGLFALADTLQPESGLLAVTVMGILLANMERVPLEGVVDFKESLSVMIISGLFIILAARVDLGRLWELAVPALAVLAVALFVARPAAALLSSIGSSLKPRERLLLGWVAPRGIVAAAVASLFALRLDELGFAGADLLVPLTFTVIIGTVLLQSLTARPFARLLGVAEPEPRGILIAGAHDVARALAHALCEQGFRTVLADNHWDDIRTARMDGLLTYYGNPVSEHADRNLDLVGVGGLIAMSHRPAFNALACTRYRSEFGSDKVYAVQTSEEKEATDKETVARTFACSHVFGEDVTLAKLASLLSKGAEIHATHLTEDFGFEAFRELYGDQAIPLFAVTPRGNLRLFTNNGELAPGAEWDVVALLTPEGLETRESQRKPRKNDDQAETDIR